jgi:hypothetical protein
MAARSGSTSGALVVSIDGRTVTGLKEFRKALKAIGPEWPKRLRQVHKRIGDRGAELSRGRAAGLGGVQAHAANTIKGSGTQRYARIAVGGQMGGVGRVAFWGAKRRTGWYAAEQYQGSGQRQHPPWVGNSWDVAVAGQGPYAINAALAAYLPEAQEEYLRMIDELAREAFPD